MFFPIYKNKNNQSGQTMIEFTLMMIATSFFIFLHMNLAYVYMMIEYIDFSTFMSARTAIAADVDWNRQKQKAQNVLNTMLAGKVDLSQGEQILGDGLIKILHSSSSIKSSQDPSELYKGKNLIQVNVKYSVPMYVFPPIFFKVDPGLSRINLVSESYLRREATYEEAMRYYEEFAKCKIQDPGVGICARGGTNEGQSGSKETKRFIYYDNGS